MTNNHMKNESEFSKQVLAAIDTGKVAMRPRVFFTLKLIAVAGVGVLVLLLSIVLINFILFTIRVSGHDTLLFFGPRGLWVFLLHFPWFLLALDIGAVILLSRLMRHFQFGYRTPVVYVLLGLALVSVLVGATLDRGTPLNDVLFEEARENRLPPPIGGLYTGMQRGWEVREGMCHCEVIGVEGDTLTVSDVRDGESVYTVQLPPEGGEFSVGDELMIAGDVDDDGVIHAFGIYEPNMRIPGAPRKGLPLQLNVR